MRVPQVPASLIVPITASTTTYGAAINVPRNDRLVVIASLTSGSVSTIDVYLQDSWDGGTTWSDVAHFTQLAANAAAITYKVVPTNTGTAIAVAKGTLASAAPVLAANKFVDGPWGPVLRIVSVTGAGTNGATATQSLLLIPWMQSMGSAQ